MLNIPRIILKAVEKKENILITGIGGDFDVFGGLPLYYTLQQYGKNIHLANYSSTNFDTIFHHSEPEVINDNLLVANSKINGIPEYYPEGYLSSWFKKEYQQDVPVWVFNKTGTIPLKNSYEYIIDKLKIDLVIAVGGVDALSTGMESGHGAILENSISIAALSEISIDKLIMCIGFGAKVEEKICHYNTLINISNLVRTDGFYGSCSLTKLMESYQFYKSACIYVFDQEQHKTSPIHRRIIPAVEGEFGNFHSTNEDENLELFISPLMPICWFFNFNSIFIFNKLLSKVSGTETFFEAVQNAVPFIKANKSIPWNSIPY